MMLKAWFSIVWKLICWMNVNNVKLENQHWLVWNRLDDTLWDVQIKRVVFKLVVSDSFKIKSWFLYTFVIIKMFSLSLWSIVLFWQKYFYCFIWKRSGKHVVRCGHKIDILTILHAVLLTKLNTNKLISINNFASIKNDRGM